MSLSNYSKFSFSALFLLLLTSSVLAQEATPPESSKDGDGKESREELDKKNSASYLEKAQYRNISFVFKDRLLQDLRSLQVIVGNFGDEVPGSKEELETLEKDYQIGIRYHYRRAYVVSGKNFLSVYKKSENLFQKFALLYERQAEELLISSVDELSKLEQDEIRREKTSERQSRYRDMEEAKFKLNLAYFQMARGDEMIRDRRYSDALVHFRLAKDFAIKLSSDLELNDDKKKDLLNKNNKHLADNRNRLFSKSAD
ncbi:hypothetical protein [Leptospira sp. GIMC2001]|uniref:hypothetical protein n=1 Tax=Leptospira sp. GIMC2001 TaxID=1513297 RepID=UPI002349A870|nr:hypothetical protein [Leptospira sp. GIMC2001]WCL50833.1 hypothetical protein O4O04_08480 [Leptospira sp. GIMC2001]